mmetsp:Transcript_10977/g.15706  ORF Transcript_10977/g.15706 Transcript_10977/m.15706 type:complete len:158 (+) Transcript_10977:58-531(+)
MAFQQVGNVRTALVGSHIRRSLPLCCDTIASAFSTTASDGCHHRHQRQSSYHHRQRRFFHHELISHNKRSHRTINFSTSTTETSDVLNKEELAKKTSDTDTTSNSESSSSPVKISMDELLALASCQPTPLSLKAMFEYAPKKSSQKSSSSAAAKKVC